jgi:large subunit ribosomal protein L23
MSTIYEVLRRPYITEKSNFQSGKLNQFVFEVAQDASKGQIKDAIETLFDVKVVRVNVINVPAKRGRKGMSRRMLVRRPGYKKALVTLASGDTIDVFEGVR